MAKKKRIKDNDDLGPDALLLYAAIQRHQEKLKEIEPVFTPAPAGGSPFDMTIDGKRLGEFTRPELKRVEERTLICVEAYEMHAAITEGLIAGEEPRKLIADYGEALGIQST